MKRRLAFAALALLALALASTLLRQGIPDSALTIRITGLNTNILPGGCEWRVAVPKARSHFDAVLFWSLRFEETNDATLKTSTVLLTPPSQSVWRETREAYNETAIVTDRYGQSWKPWKVYRVIGFNSEPGWLGLRLRSWSEHVPLVRRLLPEPKPRYATSEWYSVTSAGIPSVKNP